MFRGLFLALQAITGVNPVAEDDFGDLEKMSNAWLAWAVAQDAL